MLSIARALIRNAKLIVLDEPFEVLAPIIVRNLMETCRNLAAQGQTFVNVGQNVVAALSLADRCYVLHNGNIVYQDSAQRLRESPDVMSRYLGV